MVRVYFIADGFAKNYLEEIKIGLQKQVEVTEAKEEQHCDVILALCIIVSRVGTDIEAALRKWPPSPKPMLLVVLHRTFEPNYTVPTTQRFVDQSRAITADLLFNEDTGLLYCSRNEDSMRKAADFLSQYETYRPVLSPLHRAYSIHATVCTQNILVILLFSLFAIILFVLIFLNLLG